MKPTLAIFLKVKIQVKNSSKEINFKKNRFLVLFCLIIDKIIKTVL